MRRSSHRTTGSSEHAGHEFARSAGHLRREHVPAATTLAGSLTLLGSVSNLTVVEAAGGNARFGFWEYLKVGLPVTVATTAWGVFVLVVLVA